MSRRCAVLAAFALALGSDAAIARAQAASAPAPAEGASGVEAAAAAFQAAEAAFARGELEAALASFRAAFAAAPRDQVRFNIAVCLERLGRFDDARAEYEAAAASTTLGDDERREAQVHAAALVDRTAMVELEGGVPGDRAFVDGSERCAVPCRVFVLPGKHTIRVGSASGEERLSSELDVVGGRTYPVVAPTTARPPKAARPPSKKPAEPETEGSVGWLSIVGASAFALGAGGTIGFGLRANDLHDDYVAKPSADVRDQGLVMKGLANGSIALGALGALLFVADLALFRTGETVKVGARGMTVRF